MAVIQYPITCVLILALLFRLAKTLDTNFLKVPQLITQSNSNASPRYQERYLQT